MFFNNEMLLCFNSMVDMFRLNTTCVSSVLFNIYSKHAVRIKTVINDGTSFVFGRDMNCSFPESNEHSEKLCNAGWQQTYQVNLHCFLRSEYGNKSWKIDCTCSVCHLVSHNKMLFEPKMPKSEGDVSG